MTVLFLRTSKIKKEHYNNIFRYQIRTSLPLILVRQSWKISPSELNVHSPKLLRWQPPFAFAEHHSKQSDSETVPNEVPVATFEQNAIGSAENPKHLPPIAQKIYTMRIGYFTVLVKTIAPLELKILGSGPPPVQKNSPALHKKFFSLLASLARYIFL